jgi:predicted Zn-dependent protease
MNHPMYTSMRYPKNHSASRPAHILPPLAERLEEGRPVLSRNQITKIADRLLSLTSADFPKAMFKVSHACNVVTRVANGQVLSGDDGDTLRIYMSFGTDTGQAVWVETDQMDDTTLQSIVTHCEGIGRRLLRQKENAGIPAAQYQDTAEPVQTWHDDTVRAMTTAGQTVVPELIEAVSREGLTAAGTVSLMAVSELFAKKNGVTFYYEETDSEVTVTARSADGRASGWGGQAARNWGAIKPAEVTQRAIQTAKWSQNAQALEPGRRTAILSAEAVAQLTRFMGRALDAFSTHMGHTPLSKLPKGTKLGERVLDPRITMRSDPNDPDGGYCPYFLWGYATTPLTWFENGVLTYLRYGQGDAEAYGKKYTDRAGNTRPAYAVEPRSFRMSGGTTSVEEMIANCAEGVYVNRLSNVDLVDSKSGLVTGVTRDGCYWIKNGKIDRAVKNFRVLESPFFFLNKIDALGPAQRASFGYGIPDRFNNFWKPDRWMREPVIVPPMMVHDFNFSALADAV